MSYTQLKFYEKFSHLSLPAAPPPVQFVPQNLFDVKQKHSERVKEERDYWKIMQIFSKPFYENFFLLHFSIYTLFMVKQLSSSHEFAEENSQEF